MDNSLFNDKKSVFRDVIRLAENWKDANDSSGFEGGSPLDIINFQETSAGKKINALENELHDYLKALNYDDVKMLQIVMYLGRDKDYNKSLLPNVIYKHELEYFNKNGWVSKEVEISQMTQKLPLADYLKSGLDILKVNI